MTEVATSGRLQPTKERFPKVSARQVLQDNNSSSSVVSKAQQQAFFNKLRTATEEMQMRMRKLQEKRQAEGKVSQGRALTAACSLSSACRCALLHVLTASQLAVAEGMLASL
jgi:hypothetical protein